MSENLEEIEIVAKELVQRMGTEPCLEEQEARSHSKQLSNQLEDRFNGLPTLKEFCEEVGVETDDLERDIQLTCRDFGVAIFNRVAGFPIAMDENSIEKACRNLKLKPEEFVIINDCYQDLIDT